MDIRIVPRRLSGTIRAASSKAQAHRLLISSFLCDEPAEIPCDNTSADIETTKACLAALTGEHPLLNCGESGNTLRFLLPVAAALKEETDFYCAGTITKRTLAPLIHEMEKHGCCFDRKQATLPVGDSKDKDLKTILSVKGNLKPGIFTLPGNISSQFVSGLLFALPMLSADSEIHFTSPLKSAGYVDMTINDLKLFGIEVESSKDEFVPIYKIFGNQHYRSPGKLKIEGDWSNGAVWLAAGAINGAVSVLGLDYRSYQGEKDIIEIIKNFSGFANPSVKGVVTRTKDLFGTEVDAANIPELVPIIAILGAAAFGKTTIKNAGKLRFKRNDRLHSISKNLTALGGKVEEFSDGLIIYGDGKLNGGTVSGENDHRIVMAMTIAASICDQPVIIKGAEAVKKSYPTFFEDFKALGGDVRVV